MLCLWGKRLCKIPNRRINTDCFIYFECISRRGLDPLIHNEVNFWQKSSPFLNFFMKLLIICKNWLKTKIIKEFSTLQCTETLHKCQTVKLNILQLQHLMNEFTLFIYLEVGNNWEVIKLILISTFLDRLQILRKLNYIHKYIECFSHSVG